MELGNKLRQWIAGKKAYSIGLYTLFQRYLYLILHIKSVGIPTLCYSYDQTLL